MAKKCPKCGSTDTARILYGLPVMDEKMKRDIAEHRICLGGCCIGDNDPKYHCFKCEADFGTRPIRSSGRGYEDYRDIVQSIEFSVGGYWGPNSMVRFFRDGKTIHVTSKKDLDSPEFDELLTGDAWKKILDALFGRMYLHEWDREFYSFALDGTSWELTITLKDGETLTYEGSNAFPPYWPKLEDLMNQFLV